MGDRVDFDVQNYSTQDLLHILNLQNEIPLSKAKINESPDKTCLNDYNSSFSNASSIFFSKSPESYVNVSEVLKGIASLEIILRRRNSTGSKPSSSAAESIIRPMMKAASGRPAPR